MATIWERFSQFVKSSRPEDLDYYEDDASQSGLTGGIAAAGPVATTDAQLPQPKAELPKANIPLIQTPPVLQTPITYTTTETPPPVITRTAVEPTIPPAPPATEPTPPPVKAEPTRRHMPQPIGRSYSTPPRPTQPQSIEAVDRQEIQTNESLAHSEETEQFYPEKHRMNIPYWLEDEDTLRDEGVLFGLSESDPTEKTDIIRNYFAHLVADHARNIEQQNERVQELNLFIGQKENRIQDLQEKLHIQENSHPEGEHQLPRTLVGLTLSVAMCVGNYFLIEETLRPAFATSSFVALGVFLAGMFNLFGRISLFHDTESNVSGRRLLEEVGMPLAAALFVFAQAWQTQSWWQATSLFVFVFFLFLFAGKLFLSNITVLRNDLRVWLSTVRGRQEAVDHIQQWEEEIVSLNQEMDDLRVQKWQILREQGTSESERNRLNARRDMLIKLFESEFYLARKMKGRLTDRQLREIQGN
ncbi:hypothetical protein [Arundinibacter roseus]|uniref:Uncharacterized protein n=1 Tax=Arundinibacter roseus TaxID=2070510 RepID=A0A4R4JYL7_9BACT|nr:hypothetical protein [Arundinibacter roseus]TDB59813.1 hypothetical protein EZE20_21905 [Arundinibacter roseus]